MTNLNSIHYVVFVILFLVPTNVSEDDDKSSMFRMGIHDYLHGASTRMLNKAFEIYQFPNIFRVPEVPQKSDLVCIACNIAVPIITTAVKNGGNTKVLKKLVYYLCVGMKIENEVVCRQSIDRNFDILVYIVRKGKDVRGQRICSIIFQRFGCVDPNRKDWSVYIPPKPNVTNNIPHRKSKKNLKILQITDVHFNPTYKVGSNAACDAPMCCENDSVPILPQNTAGRWGDYRNCDVSYEQLVTSLHHIMTTHKYFDYVYFVGDIVDHKIWDTSRQRNAESIILVMSLFKIFFRKIPVLPILGNHESHPVNVFDTDVSNLQTPTQWLYEFIQNEWSFWLPPNTRGTILRGGFYSVVVKPGFRVIGLNSNMCYVFNWWLLYDDKDPYRQLEWLVTVLLQSERNNEKVHILSHIPSGNSYCLANWGKEYSKIVSRFSETIVGQFNGHTHKIQKTIYYDTDNITKPVNIAFNGGSLTPFANVNPNYVVYSVDGNAYEVEDYDLWIYDITEANLQPNNIPRWYKLYSFKNAFEVDNINPYEMDKLVTKMLNNCKLQDLYFKFKYKNAHPSISNGCDVDCDYENICKILTSYHGDYSRCENIKHQLNACK